MKYDKCKDGSFLHNCLIKSRGNDPAGYCFYLDGNTISVFLNGYAIIPIEDYYAMKNEKLSKTAKKNIRAAHKALRK